MYVCMYVCCKYLVFVYTVCTVCNTYIHLLVLCDVICTVCMYVCMCCKYLVFVYSMYECICIVVDYINWMSIKAKYVSMYECIYVCNRYRRWALPATVSVCQRAAAATCRSSTQCSAPSTPCKRPHTYIHIYILTCIHTYIHTLLLVYIHTYIHTYIVTCIHTYIYTSYTYIYTKKAILW